MQMEASLHNCPTFASRPVSKVPDEPLLSGVSPTALRAASDDGCPFASDFYAQLMKSFLSDAREKSVLTERASQTT